MDNGKRNILTDKRIVFIGGGKMAEAVFSGLLSSAGVRPDQITIVDIAAARLEALRERYDLNTILSTESSLPVVLAAADIVVLAVTPQACAGVLRSIAPLLSRSRHTVISIMGGVELALLESALDGIAIVRVMPNTPSLVHTGLSGIALGKDATTSDGEIALAMFSQIGMAYLMPESLIDPMTGISGCGPAFAYLFIEALADGGVEMGLSREMALNFAAQTLIGAGQMVLSTGEHPGRLKDNVCSPAGATIAGVRTLEEKGMRGAVIDAVLACVMRMREVACQAGRGIA